MSETRVKPNHETVDVNENLTLRQLQPEDADGLFAVIDSSRENLRKWLPWVDDTKSAADSAKFIEYMGQQREAGKEFGYAIVIDGQIAGHISLMGINSESAEVGYWIGDSFAGKGLTTNATKGLIDFAFNELDLTFLTLRTDSRNSASRAVAKKAGFAEVGESTETDHYGEPRTTIDYRIDRSQSNEGEG